MDYVNAALASLQLGDEKTYLRLREEMTERFKDAYEVAPWRTLEVGLLRPIDDRVKPAFKPSIWPAVSTILPRFGPASAPVAA